jgi:hypothetical protein
MNCSGLESEKFFPSFASSNPLRVSDRKSDQVLITDRGLKSRTKNRGRVTRASARLRNRPELHNDFG